MTGNARPTPPDNTPPNYTPADNTPPDNTPPENTPPENTPPDRDFTTIWLALLFEGGLGVIALVLAWLTGTGLGPWPAPNQPGGTAIWPTAVVWGLAGTLPLAAVLLMVEQIPVRLVRDLGTLVQQKLGPILGSASWWELALLSILAGVGEELLFRGWIQYGLGQWLFGSPESVGGLLLAAVAFGACHAVTRSYALVAGLVGLYLGLLQNFSGHLLAPIIAHAGYDFIALVYLLKWRAGGGEPRERPS